MRAVLHQIRGVEIAEASKILDFIRFLECGERWNSGLGKGFRWRFYNFKFEGELFATNHIRKIELPEFTSKSQSGKPLIKIHNILDTESAP